MGAEESTNLPPVQIDPHCLCLIIKIPDKIQVINATDQEYTLIRTAILKTWKEGIQIVKLKCGKSVLSFKLKGLPFETGLLSQHSRDVVCEILHHLQERGWHHLVSTNLTYARDLFTFIFIKQRPMEMNHLGYMSLSSNDKLQFCNLLPGTFEEALEASKMYPPGSHRGELLEDKPNTYELVLGGCPWGGKSYKHAEARYLLIKLLSIVLCKHQFVCTMNIKRTEDTFLFCPKTTTENIKDSDLVIVTLRKTKKIQIYNATDELAETLHQLVNNTFQSRGVKIERKIEHVSHKIEYKFKFPMKSDSDIPKSCFIKFFVCKLLETMRAHGWKILTGFDMSRGLSYKSELLFQRGTYLANCKAFCLSPIEGSRLSLFNAPRDIVNDCTHILKSHWHKPLKHCAEVKNIITYQVFGLDGNPWDGTSLDAYYAHGIMCHILKRFSEKGYALVLAADIIGDCIEYDQGKSYEHNPNAWWFLHGPEDWERLQPSAPPTSSELAAAASNLPSINSVLRDDFKQPPVSDFYAHPGTRPPQLYPPYNPSEASNILVPNHGNFPPTTYPPHNPTEASNILVQHPATFPPTTYPPHNPSEASNILVQHPGTFPPTPYPPHNPSEASNSSEKGALEDEMPPPPSYESVMKQEGRMF